MEITKANRKWLDNLHLSHPVVIAGPCSAETEEQVLKIAHALKDTDVTYYRAGIWKPRTRPGMFEGVGALGLKWLERVKKGYRQSHLGQEPCKPRPLPMDRRHRALA